MAHFPGWLEATVVDSVGTFELLEDQPALGFAFFRMVTGQLADLPERLHG